MPYARSLGGLMNSSVSFALVAVMLTVSLLVPPSLASADNMVFRHTDPGTGWSSWAFQNDGSPVEVKLAGVLEEWPGHMGLNIYDSEDRLQWSYLNTWLSGRTGAYVDVNVAPGVGYRHDARDPNAKGGGTTTIAWKIEPVGTFKILAWSSGGMRETTLTIDGAGAKMVCSLQPDGTCSPVSDAGDDTFLFTSGDFKGLATVQGGPDAGGATRLANRANVLTSTEVAIDNSLLAAFQPGLSPGANTMSMDGPDGSVECPCKSFSMAPDSFGDRKGPGSYTFNLTGAGTYGGVGEVYVAGADARLVNF